MSAITSGWSLAMSYFSEGSWSRLESRGGARTGAPPEQDGPQVETVEDAVARGLSAGQRHKGGEQVHRRAHVADHGGPDRSGPPCDARLPPAPPAGAALALA